MLASAEAVEEEWAWGLAVEWALGSVLTPVSGWVLALVQE